MLEYTFDVGMGLWVVQRLFAGAHFDGYDVPCVSQLRQPSSIWAAESVEWSDLQQVARNLGYSPGTALELTG